VDCEAERPSADGVFGIFVAVEIAGAVAVVGAVLTGSTINAVDVVDVVAGAVAVAEVVVLTDSTVDAVAVADAVAGPFSVAQR
jgi:hypothetical protein